MAVFAADFPLDPNSDPGVGGQWTHPETNVVYEWDGVAWNIAGSSGGGGGNNGGTPPGGGGNPGNPPGTIDLSGDVEIGTDCKDGSLTVHSPAAFECGVVIQDDVLIEGELNVMGAVNINPVITNDIVVEGNLVIGKNCNDTTLEVKSPATFECAVDAESGLNAQGKLTLNGEQVALEEEVREEAAKRIDGDAILQKQIDNVAGYDDNALYRALRKEETERKIDDASLLAKENALQVEVTDLKKDIRHALGQASNLAGSLDHYATDKQLADESHQRAIGDSLLDGRIKENSAAIDVNKGLIGSEIDDRIASDDLIKDLAKQHFDEINKKINSIIGALQDGSENAELVNYDDTFLREMLEAEKVYRVEEDTKIVQRIDQNEVTQGQTNVFVAKELDALKILSNAWIVVSEEDPLNDAQVPVQSGTIWHRYNPDEPQLGTTFIAVTGENGDLVWVSLAGAKSLDELNDVELDLLTKRNQRPKAKTRADLGEGHFEPNQWNGTWSYYKGEHDDLSTNGGWYLHNNPEPKEGVEATDLFQELIIGLRDDNGSNLAGQFDSLQEGSVVLISHKSFGSEPVAYPISKIEHHDVQDGYGKRCSGLVQIDESLFLKTEIGAQGGKEALTVQFGVWVPDANTPDPIPEPGVDPYIDCFLGYDAATQLWCAKLINCSGGTCIVAESDPLGTHSGLGQGTIWHQIESGATPSKLRENDSYNTFVLVDADDGSQFWSKTTGSYLSTDGGTVDGGVVFDNTVDSRSPIVVMGSIEKDDVIERGKVLSISVDETEGDEVLYRGQIKKDLAIVTKKYVDDQVQDIGGGNVRVPFNLVKEPPENAADGTLWFPADEISLKVRYDGEWIPAVTDPYSGAYLPKDALAVKRGPLEIRIEEGTDSVAETLFSIHGTYSSNYPSDQTKIFWYDRNVDANGSPTADSVQYKGRIEEPNDVVNKKHLDTTVEEVLGNIEDDFFNKVTDTAETVSETFEKSGSSLQFIKRKNGRFDYNKPRSFFNYKEGRSKSFVLGNANPNDKSGNGFHGSADAQYNGETIWQKAYRMEVHNCDDIYSNATVKIQSEVYDRADYTEYYNVKIRPNASYPSGEGRPSGREKDRTVIKALRYFGGGDGTNSGLAFYGFVADPDDSTKWDSIGDDTGTEGNRAANKGYVDRSKFHPGDTVAANSDSDCSNGGMYVDGDRVYIKLN